MPKQLRVIWMLVCFAGGMVLSQPSGGRPLWQKLAQANTTDDSLWAEVELLKYYTAPSVDTSLQLVLKALPRARKRAKPDKLMGEVYYRSAVVYFHTSQISQTSVLLDTALRCFQAAGYRLGEALIYNVRASIEGTQGHFPQAVDLLIQSLQIADQLPMNDDIRSLQGMCLNNLAGVYFNLQNYRETIRYCKRSIALHTVSKSSEAVPRAYLSIGRSYRVLGQYDSAQIAFDQALSFPLLKQNPQDYAYALSSMGELQLDLGCVPEAIAAFEQALALPFTNLSRRANILAKLARTYHISHQEEKSRQKAEEALAIADKNNFPDAQLGACEVLAAYHKRHHQYQLALQYLERFSSLRNGIDGKEVQTSVIRQETAYLLEKKQRELAFAEAREQEQERQARIQFRYLMGMGAALLLMAVLAFFLARNIRQKHLVNSQLRQQSDILRQQKTEIEIQAARTGQLNKIKDRLLSVMAHDMRSPFSTLQGLLPLITAKAFSEEQLKNIVDQLFKLSQSTVNMMEDVLLWANAELRGGVSHSDLLYPADLALEVFAFLEEPAGAKNIALHQEIAEKVSCFGNVGDVRLILRNLVSNAVKFTPTGGNIRVFSETEGDFVKISVADTGTGMTHEQVNQLLHADFVRSTPGTAGEKGTGLGLMLCMEFVQRNGGEMTIESEPGKGSTFSFTLPVKMLEIKG